MPLDASAQDEGDRMATALSEFDLYLFAQGTHNRAYDKLGAHLVEQGGHRGVHFAVWAPNARNIFLIGLQLPIPLGGLVLFRDQRLCRGFSGRYGGSTQK